MSINIQDYALIQQCIDKKWVPILQGTHKDNGHHDCFLCGIYYEDCRKCPIGIKTKDIFCDGTPYSILHDLLGTFDWNRDNYPYDIHAELTACVQWEIDFLTELKEE